MADITINHTEKGSHGIHWQAFFADTIDQETIFKRFVHALDTGEKLEVNDTVTVVTDPWIRGIIKDNKVITGFPYVKGFNYQDFTIKTITEWTHAENLEAVINATHASGCSVSFFATDYALHKEIYTTQQNLSLNILGIVYALIDFDPEEFNKVMTGEAKFTEDFCGYIPKSEDEIEFIGRIKAVREHTIGEIKGFIITVGVTPDCDLEFFITNHNLTIEIPINKPVRGIAWMQGTLKHPQNQ